MTALATDTERPYKDGLEVPFKVYRSTHIYGNAWVCSNATGYLVPGADTAGLRFQGVAQENVNNTGGDGAMTCKVRRKGLFKATIAHAVTLANLGKQVFLVDDNTVDLAEYVSNAIYCGNIAGIIDSTHVWVDIDPAIIQADVATHIADTTGAHPASAISVTDAGNLTSNTTVEEVLAEILTHLKSAKGIIQIPMPVITDAGVALAAFVDGDSATPGYCVTAKGLGIRWNNHATPGAVAAKVPVPPDADVAANMVLHILAAKTGATPGDATAFTVAAYNNDVGALYDADDTFGGDTSAMDADATAKTVQEVTLTLAPAGLTAYPAAIELTIKPKDNTLGTDDVIMLAAWIEYKKKLLTA